MKFESLSIDGAKLITPQRHEDPRGFFARTHCAREFTEAGLPPGAVQSSISYNRLKGTVRGMHSQWPPSMEGKTVRCVRGALLDVLLDLRPSSPTYLQHQTIGLDDSNRLAVYIPPGIAHGFQTQVDDTEVLYIMSDYFAPGLAHGVRWNDPRFGIEWPLPAVAISERDATYADFDVEAYETELRSHTT